jgi:hypothetical protein
MLAWALTVVVYASSDADPRIGATKQAIDFWNRTMVALGKPAPFEEPEIIVRAPVARALETYAYKVSEDGWHLYPGAPGLEPPEALNQLRGDIVMLLSAQRLLSFSWPLADRPRYFVAIRSDRYVPVDDPSAARNIIAHELGHTLGLMHNAGAGNLMCGSCEMRMATSEPPTFLPLLPEDRAWLLSR